MEHEPHVVLVVDDDDELRESLSELLELEGFGVEGASNGREALAYLQAHLGAPPCVIVLDLMMPVMSGPELRAEQLRDDVLARIPVVVLTASSHPERQAEALRAVGYFSKPLRFEAFFDVLRSHC